MTPSLQAIQIAREHVDYCVEMGQKPHEIVSSVVPSYARSAIVLSVRTYSSAETFIASAWMAMQVEETRRAA